MSDATHSEGSSSGGSAGPILFVTGSPRSGTTLVARILTYYHDYGMGPEGHWIMPYARRIQSFGDLARDENARRLIDSILGEEMFEIVRARYPAERRVDITTDMVWEDLADRTYAGVVYAVLASLTRGLHRTHVGNKNPGFLPDLEALHALFPQAKFLFVIRDGRDVALSMMEQHWGQKSWYANARFWAQNCERTERFRATIDEDRQLLLRFEDVLRDTEATSRRLEHFLGRSLNADNRARLVAELTVGTRSDNYEKWRRHMGPRQHRLFEAAAGEWLERFGYPRQAPAAVAYTWERAYYMGLEYGRRVWGRGRAALGLRYEKRTLN